MAGIYTTVACGTVTQANMKISAVDGTAFVDFGYLYQSNFSVGEDSWSAGGGTAAGNIDSIGGEDNWLRFTCNNLNAVHRVYNSAALLVGNRYTIQIRYYITAGNSDITSLTVYGGGASAPQRISANGELNTVGSIATYTVTFTNRFAGGISVYANTANVFQDAGGDDTFYIKDITIRQELPVGHLLKIRDSLNRAIHGFIKAAGTVETLGSDVFAGFDFTNTGIWAPYNATVIDANSFSVTSPIGRVQANLFTIGGLYKTSFSADETSGISSLTNAFSVPDGSVDVYRTAIAGAIRVQNNSIATVDVTTMQSQQVLTPSETGVTIVSTKGGSTFNFALKNSAFNYNDSSGYTYEIIQVRQLPVIATHSITAGNALIDATEANAFAAPVGVDLSAYQDGQHMLAMYDSSGYAAIAHISATAPSGAAFGSELITNPSFDANTTGWSVGRGTMASSHPAGGGQSDDYLVLTSNGEAGGPYVYQNILVSSGELMLMQRYAKSGTSTGRAEMYYNSSAYGIINDTSTSSWVNATKYVNAVSGGLAIYLQASQTTINGQTMLFDEVSAKVLTMPAATGALLLSTKGGSRGWLYKHASFNPNSAITAKILFIGD